MTQKRPMRNDEVEELETAFRNLSDKTKNRKSNTTGAKKEQPKKKPSKASENSHAKGKYAKKGFSKSNILMVSIAAFVVIAVVAGFLIYNHIHNNQRISANLTIMGIDVSDMTRAEAEKAVKNQFNALYKNQEVTLTIEDKSVSIPSDVAGVKLNVSKAVDAAIKYSGTDNTDPNALHALDITKFISYKSRPVMELLDPFRAQFSATLIQTSYVIEGTKPTVWDKVDEKASLEIVIKKGVPGYHLDMTTLLEGLESCYNTGVNALVLEYVITEPDPLNYEEILKKYCMEPVEAVMDPETFEITGGTYGYGIDVQEVEAALAETPYGETVRVPYHWTAPEDTKEELSALLFRDVLASYETYASSDYNRNINLELAAAACNNLILYPGDVFSFNGTLGERTADKGYKPGASYVGGQTVYDYGGGICQVATTIYYCAVVSDLEILERDCHQYASSYTPLSTDATIFWNGIDMRFRNNTKYPIRIEASSSNGDVFVKLIGTETKDYYVKFESEHLDTYPFEEEFKEFEADNEKGYKDGQVLTDPYTGYKSRSFRAKYDKATGKLIERTLENVDVYSTRNRVICKIIGTETEPPTTEPGITVPPSTGPSETVPPETNPPETTTPPETVPPAVDDPTPDTSTTEPPASGGDETT